MNQDDDAYASAEEALAFLAGKCLHEVRLDRLIGLLGLQAYHNGGTMVVQLDRLHELDGFGVSIVFDKSALTATVSLTEGKVASLPAATHPAPAGRQ